MQYVPSQPHCPYCLKLLDGTTALDGDPALPVPGDLTICIGCHQPLMYTETMQLRKLTVAEFNALPAELKAELLAASLSAFLSKKVVPPPPETEH